MAVSHQNIERSTTKKMWSVYDYTPTIPDQRKHLTHYCLPIKLSTVLPKFRFSNKKES